MIAVTKDPLLDFVLFDTLIPTSEPDRFAMYWPQGQTETVVSLQPDGRLETRPAAAVGPWESGKKVGDKLVFVTDQAVKVFGLIEGL